MLWVYLFDLKTTVVKITTNGKQNSTSQLCFKEHPSQIYSMAAAPEIKTDKKPDWWNAKESSLNSAFPIIYLWLVQKSSLSKF